MQKLAAVILAAIFIIAAPLAVFAAKNITLDVSKYNKSKVSLLTEQRKLGSGAMVYKIPKAWTGVESPLDNIEGYSYRLNEIPEEMKSDSEVLYLFYFSDEKYLLNQTDASNREGIEKAIIKNILPGTNFSKVNMSIFGFPTARVGKDGLLSKPQYDFFDTNYKDQNGKIHNVEFVFVPSGQKGMCCALYIYTDSVHKDVITALLHEIQIK